MNHLRREFDEFDAANPDVWKMFVRFAQDAIRAGHTSLSASLIVERIRWETQIVTRSSADDFKVNNNHRAYYARKFNALYSSSGGKFSTRCATGEVAACLDDDTWIPEELKEETQAEMAL